MKLSILAIVAIAATALAGCGGIANASPPASAGIAALQTARAQDAAGAYCKQTGGDVELRRPVYGSNSSDLLFLAGEKSFCQYTSKKDGSRIHILLETLYTTKPSLAALAYILKPAPRLVQRQSGVLLLLVAWGFRSIWRNVRRGRRLVQQERDRPNARSVYLSRYVVDRLLGVDLPCGGNYSRNQLAEGDALQVYRLGACWVPIVILSLSIVILSLSIVILSLSMSS